MQRALVRSAVGLLKRDGGTLVYSTCTVDPLENEAVVARALADHPQGLRLVDAWGTAGALRGSPRLARAGRAGFGLDARARAKVLRFDPTDAAVDSIGFFVAKFVTSTVDADADAAGD